MDPDQYWFEQRVADADFAEREKRGTCPIGCQLPHIHVVTDSADATI